ncbi:MAG: hypothetical protein SFV81_12955 [Pirellulaceae bacterium]|nr:hypothetical protein [Pirellulaceae bacterium]
MIAEEIVAQLRKMGVCFALCTTLVKPERCPQTRSDRSVILAFL